MNNSVWRHIKAILAIGLTLAVAVSFLPVNSLDVHAASFSKSGSVSGLQVSKTTATSVTLTWNAYSGADGYQIYKSRTKNGEYKLINTTSSTTYKRKNLTTNLSCYYKVRAYDETSSGTAYSKFSSVVKGTPYGFSKTGKVSDFKVSATSYNSVSFTWSSYTKAEGYQIYKSRSKDGTYTRIKTTTKTSFKRTNLTTNLTCYYKIRAYKKDSSGNKVYSKFTSPIEGTPKLSAPTLTIKNASSYINLSWTAPSGASGYGVYRATSKTGTYTKIATVTSTSYKDASVTKGDVYYYKVRAYRTVSGSKKYGKYCTAIAASTALKQVTNVSATSGTDAIKVTWTKVSGAEGYQIYRATGSSSATFTKVGTATTNSFSDKNVANGLTYYYKVRAYKTVDGSKIYGTKSSLGHSRAEVVAQAVSWLGCKESNGSHKKIIDVYRKYSKYNFPYYSPWCAVYVSAVAIKTDTTSIIVTGTYCPTIMSTYKNSKTSNYSFGKGSSYKPSPGDVIFFDWNKNGVPDHTGLVATVSGNTIKTIEGNKSDAVSYRTFSVGYGYVLGYGLPNYNEASGVVFTGTSSAVGCGELIEEGIGTEPEGYEDLGEEYDLAVDSLGDVISEDSSATENAKMEAIIKAVRTNAKSEDSSYSKSQYYAAFVYKLCDKAGINASIVTEEDEEGNVNAWIEASIDGAWYKIDASDENAKLEEYTPEVTDIKDSEAEALGNEADSETDSETESVTESDGE